MKKLFVLTLAIALVFALATTAFAASTITSVTQNNAATTQVYATIHAGNSNAPVYAVDVAFDDLSFSYSYGKNWNPSTLTYDNLQAGAWTDSEGAVTVTNRSNADVVATVAFRAVQGITATFKNNKSSATLTDASIGARATSETFTVTVAGTPDLSGTTAKIGDITVTITAS